MIIGLILSKKFIPDQYTSVTVEYWTVKQINLDTTTRTGFITLAPYLNKTFYLANGVKSYYATGIINFSFNPSNWPFVVGTDPIPKAYAFIQSHTQTIDDDGNEINGGLDWSQAVQDIV